MLALMKNNYYKAIGNLRVFGTIILVYGLVNIFINNKIVFTNFVTFAAFSLASGSASIVEFTGSKNFERQVLAFPVTRKGIVKSIYLFQLIIALCIGLFVFVIGLLNMWYNKQSGAGYLENYLLLSFCASSMVLLLTSIYQPLSYIMVGKYKFLSVMIASFFAFGVFYWSLNIFKENFEYSDPKILIFVGIATVSAMLIFYILSYFVSKSIFENKNIENYSDI